MAYNLGTLVSTAQSRLRDTSFSSTLLKQFCNDAQRELFNNHRLRFMESSTPMTTSTGSQSLSSLPSNFQLALDLRITSPASYATLLQFMTEDDFDKSYPQPSLAGNGVPFLWYDSAGIPKIFPQADALGYTITMRYLKTPVELSADADVPEIPAEFQEILILGMIVRAEQTKENFDQAMYLQQGLDELILDMVKRFGFRQAGGPIIMPLNGR